MTIGRFLRTPKGLLLIVLGVIALIAMLASGVRLTAPGVAAASLAAMAADALILRLRKGKWLFPSGALLTGLIVAMILNPRLAWYIPAATSAIAIASKYVVRGPTANVFNPAALARVIAFHLFGSAQSWWGALAEMHPLALVVLVGTGGYIVFKVNKVPVVLTFLASYFLLFTLTAFVRDPAPLVEIFRAPDLQAALFFALFMLTDPPTSPPKHRDQVAFALITSAFSFAAFELLGTVYFLLAGLLVANAWEGWRRHRAHARQTATRSSSGASLGAAAALAGAARRSSHSFQSE